MKVIAINGSPKEKGNTFHALRIMKNRLEEQDIETHIIHIGNKAIRGCMSCNSCYRTQSGKCAFTNDCVNEIIDIMKDADGFILGTPVYFGGISGTMKCFLDRSFYVSGSNGNLFRHKVGAGVSVVRRSGGVCTFDELGHYFCHAEMITPTSNYWNVIHGCEEAEILKDIEGVQTLQVLADNMAWILKLIEAGKSIIPEPEKSEKIGMNFIR